MKIIYWSGTGNTEAMAELISEGMKEQGSNAELINISRNEIGSINEDTIVLGCPSMGAEELEESEFRPALDSIKENLRNKKVVLFGSYGWGDGEWMRNWEEEMLQNGSMVPLDSLIINNEPDEVGAKECIEFGKKIAKL